MKKNRVIFSFLTVILTAFISSYAAQDSYPPKEKDFTFLRAIVHLVTGNHISLEAQKIIFDYLKTPILCFGFKALINGIERREYKLPDSDIIRVIKKINISQEEIIMIMGHDYNSKQYVLSNGVIPSAPATEENKIDFAFNPEHPGAWLVPGEEEPLLSCRLPNTDNIDIERFLIEGAEKAIIEVLTKRKQKMLEPPKDQKNATSTHARWNDADFVKKIFPEQCCAPTPLLLTSPSAQTEQTTIPVNRKTRLDAIVARINHTGLPLEIQNIIFEYLQTKVQKRNILFQTPEGLRAPVSIHRLNINDQKTRYKYPWELVDSVPGIDEYGRLHIAVDKTSTCKKPDCFTSLQILDQESLCSFAKLEKEFIVPGPEEEMLKELVTAEEKPTQLKSKKNRRSGAHRKPKECVIQ